MDAKGSGIQLREEGQNRDKKGIMGKRTYPLKYNPIGKGNKP